MAYGDRGLYADDGQYVPSGPLPEDTGYGFTDKTTEFGKTLPSVQDEYLNSAWKHMLGVDRFCKSYTASDQQLDEAQAPVYGDRGNFRGGYDSYTGKRQSEYESIDKQEQEKIDRWNRYVGNADTYINAARTNRDQMRKGNALLVGEALEDAMSNSGIRGGKAIREVRPA